MAELEINCLKAQGLKQCIGSEEDMNRIKDAIVRERNERRAKITWGFTKAKSTGELDFCGKLKYRSGNKDYY
jgi:hypothetical protein